VPQTGIWIPFAVHAISVVLPGRYVWKVRMPDMTIDLVERNSLFLICIVAWPIEQT